MAALGARRGAAQVGIDDYRRDQGFKRKVELEPFLNWLAARHGAASPRSLCLSMNKYAIGMLIKNIAAGVREERSTRDKAIKELRENRRKEWRAALDEEAEESSQRAKVGECLSDAARDALVTYGGCCDSVAPSTRVDASTRVENQTQVRRDRFA